MVMMTCLNIPTCMPLKCWHCWKFKLCHFLSDSNMPTVMKPAKVVAAIFIFCLLKLANLKRLAVQTLSLGQLNYPLW